jgi:DsbC/DsbD-like thiol-disulfide interchange protein
MTKILRSAVLIFSFGFVLPFSHACAVDEPGVTITSVKGGVFENKMYAGLRYTVQPGYKTYWRTPGYGGIAPEITFTKSENVKSTNILWLPPNISETADLTNYVYDQEIVIPVEVTPVDPALPVVLRWQANFGYCEKQCLPGEASGKITQTAEDPLSAYHDVRKSLALLPAAMPENIKITAANLLREGKNLLITFQILTDETLADGRFIYEIGDPEFEITAPVLRKTGDGYDAAIELIKIETIPQRLTVTLETDHGAAYTAEVPLTAPRNAPGGG